MTAEVAYSGPSSAAARKSPYPNRLRRETGICRDSSNVDNSSPGPNSHHWLLGFALCIAESSILGDRHGEGAAAIESQFACFAAAKGEIAITSD